MCFFARNISGFTSQKLRLKPEKLRPPLLAKSLAILLIKYPHLPSGYFNSSLWKDPPIFDR